MLLHQRLADCPTAAQSGRPRDAVHADEHGLTHRQLPLQPHSGHRRDHATALRLRRGKYGLPQSAAIFGVSTDRDAGGKAACVCEPSVAVANFLELQSHLEVDCFDEDGNNAVALTALVLATPEKPERLATLQSILQLLLRRDPEDGGADKSMYDLTALDVAETPASRRLLHVPLLARAQGQVTKA